MCHVARSPFNWQQNASKLKIWQPKSVSCLISYAQWCVLSIFDVLMFACRDAAVDQELGPYPFKRNQWCKQTVLCTVLRILSRAKDKTLSNFDQS